MSNETVVTLVGNLTNDPELRFTPSGAPVANFTVASTPRSLNRQTQEWEDGTPLFLSCAVWREAAENVAETLTKGMRVIVQGRLKSERYTDKQSGQERTAFKVDVDEVGPALRYATAKVERKPANGQRQTRQQRPEREDDPWAAAQPGGAAQANQDPWGAPGQGRADVESPF
jgi:single-strand DNA-binding protein